MLWCQVNTEQPSAWWMGTCIQLDILYSLHVLARRTLHWNMEREWNLEMGSYNQQGNVCRMLHPFGCRYQQDSVLVPEQDQYMPVQPHTLYTMHFLEVSSNLAYKALEAESHWYSCSQQDKEHNVGSLHRCSSILKRCMLLESGWDHYMSVLQDKENKMMPLC